MITGFVTLISALLAIVFYMMKRHDTAKADPLTQNRQRYEQIDQDIAHEASDVATAHATDDLDELDRLQHGQNSLLRPG